MRLSGRHKSPVKRSSPQLAFPPATPFTLQVTVAIRASGHGGSILRLAAERHGAGTGQRDRHSGRRLPAEVTGLAEDSPQAVSRSTKNVLKIAQVRGRQVERMFFSSSGHCEMPKNVRRETRLASQASYSAGTEEQKKRARYESDKSHLLPGVYRTHSGKAHFFCNDAS